MNLAPLAAFAVFACLPVSAALAQPAETRSFSVPGHGSLVLDVPKGWRVAERPNDQPPSIYVRFDPSSGDAFVVQITALWLDAEKRAKQTPQAMKELEQKQADKMLAQAEEKQAKLVELRGRQARGYHYSLADRTSANKGDDYKYLTQGSLMTGELLAIFTVLQREPVARDKALILQMLAEARHSAEAGAPRSDTPRADALQVKESGSAYELSVPVSRLVMTLPKGGMPGVARQRGGNDHPRYFYFSGGGLNVSGWFEPASGYNGLQPFWEEETATWRKRGLPPPVDTTFARIGKWDAVLYDIAFPVGTNSHIRAHWVEAGTWIDVHLSLTSNASSADNRGRLTELLKAIEVREKN
jgi:hypothetical protein